jgi:TPP-dependent pyruvate/acetoin dehydrogenase alpha subunit
MMDATTRKALYRAMSRIRTVEERIADLYPEQEMRCPVHLCIGQEAAEAGTGLALDRRDYALSGHRSHGHYLAKGGDLKGMMAEIYGKATGCAGGKGGSMHLVDLDAGFLGAVPIVGSTIPIAVGTAFSSKMKGEDRVTMVFFGDGATEAGVFHESLNFAALHALPIVFVCENNLYSVYSPMGVRQPDGRSIAGIAAAHGVATQTGDGNDAEAVFTLASKAVDAARRGQGPVFIELSTYRWREHCGPNFDNHIGYRTEAEYEEWRQRDPLALYRARLIADGAATGAELAAIDAELAAEMEDAVTFAKSSPFPPRESAGQHIYAE